MGRAGKGGLTAAEEARCLNVIGDYVARRDVPALTRAALAEAGVELEAMTVIELLEFVRE